MITIKLYSNCQSNNKQNGFVALLSTIIIGSVLMLMTIEAGKLGFYISNITLGNEAKEQSRNLAVSCGDKALAQILIDVNFELPIRFVTDVGVCNVNEIKKNYPSNEYLTIYSQADVRGAITNLELIYKIGNVYLGDEPLQLSLPRQKTFIPQLHNSNEILVMP